MKRNQRADGAKRMHHDFAQLQSVDLERLQSNADLSSTMANQIESSLCDLAARGINLVGGRQLKIATIIIIFYFTTILNAVV